MSFLYAFFYFLENNVNSILASLSIQHFPSIFLLNVGESESISLLHRKGKSLRAEYIIMCIGGNGNGMNLHLKAGKSSSYRAEPEKLGKIQLLTPLSPSHFGRPLPNNWRMSFNLN